MSCPSKEFNTSSHANNRWVYWDTHYFDSIDTEQKAYWLGFWYGDGSVYKQKGTYRSKLCVKEIELVQQFARDIKCTKIPNNGELVLFGAEWLSMPRKPERQFPVLDEDYIRHFIRGLFDADGSVSISDNGQCRNFHSTICHASKDLLSMVAKILGTRVIKGHHTNQISINGRYRIQSLALYLYSDATRYLKYKADRFREAWTFHSSERVGTFIPCFIAENEGIAMMVLIIKIQGNPLRLLRLWSKVGLMIGIGSDREVH